ncbi:cytochrome P450 [Streptomyces huiliensis]|uniref:cytochrome P450 n=1 Tax=Streptomyces huiliensis TaxID=2876027 RepID=UPI001CBF1484|nr:cytochrome P450 [Streptomyces huiliensis]MBZ4323066.1 cytochrome P450 [Streptomyces huiliensis]
MDGRTQPRRIAVSADFWDHLPFDMRGEAFRTDPYAAYARLRAEGPVLAPGEGVVLVTGYHAGVGALGDPRFGLGGGALEAQSFLLVDPPEHRCRRARVSAPFSARAVERLRPAIRHRTAGLVRAAAVRGEAEVVADFAVPLALELICAVVGVPLEDRPRWYGALAGLSLAFVPTGLLAEEDAARLTAARLEFAHYLRTLIEERRRAPQDDLVSALLAQGPEDTPLDEQDIITAIGQFVVAGHQPVVLQMANGAHALLRHPEQLDRLRADPSRAAAVVEEVMRYDPSIHLISRIALRDADIAGRHVPAGTVVGVLPGAANRDPRAFADSDRFDIARSPQHLALGRGTHFCLGAHLVRLQAQALFAALARYRPALTGEAVPRRMSGVLWGTERLPVVLTERPSDGDEDGGGGGGGDGDGD